MSELTLREQLLLSDNIKKCPQEKRVCHLMRKIFSIEKQSSNVNQATGWCYLQHVKLLLFQKLCKISDHHWYMAITYKLWVSMIFFNVFLSMETILKIHEFSYIFINMLSTSHSNKLDYKGTNKLQRTFLSSVFSKWKDDCKV